MQKFKVDESLIQVIKAQWVQYWVLEETALNLVQGEQNQWFYMQHGCRMAGTNSHKCEAINLTGSAILPGMTPKIFQGTLEEGSHWGQTDWQKWTVMQDLLTTTKTGLSVEPRQCGVYPVVIQAQFQ